MRKRKFYKNQREAFYYCHKVRHPALFMEMRLGKTIVTIRRLVADYQSLHNKKFLIITPYSALYGWRTELLMEGLTDEDINIITGSKDKRLKSLYNRQRSIFSLTNYESYRSISEMSTLQWDAVVLDESTQIKAPPAMNWSRKYDKRPNTSKWYTENFRDVERRFILSGLPMPEGELDIFMQLQFLDPSILPFDNYYQMRFHWFKQDRYSYVITDEGRNQLNERLSKYCLFQKRKEYNLGGRKIYISRVGEFTNKTRKLYRTIEKEYIAELNDTIINTTDHAMTRWQWLRGLCGGLLRGRNNIHFENDVKLKMLDELIYGDLKNDQVVIWACFTEEINIIAKRYNIESISGLDDPEIRYEKECSFNDGLIRVIVCQPECYKFGANFSSADTAIYYSSPLPALTRQQSEDRIVSINTGSKLIIDLLVRNTIDEDIYISHIRKESMREMNDRIIKSLQARNK